MHLQELLERGPPAPWSHGGKIPWHEPDFSARMLQEHLSQDHDLASRRFAKIDAQVEWLNHEILPDRASVLDLGCGPGLYTSRLADLGHACVGIDFSPSSIAYARSEAKRSSLNCTYLLQDLTKADFPSGFDAVLFMYGEFNTFPPRVAEQLLVRARQSLKLGGHLVLEVSTEEQVRRLGTAAPSWYISKHGLFANEPHICLIDCAWDDVARVSVERFTVFCHDSDRPDTYVCTTQAYADSEYNGLLHSAGFLPTRWRVSPADSAQDESSALVMITAVASGS